jgi:hypothetical protein
VIENTVNNIRSFTVPCHPTYADSHAADEKQLPNQEIATLASSSSTTSSNGNDRLDSDSPAQCLIFI